MRALSTSQDDVESEADLVSREDLTVYKIVYNGPDAVRKRPVSH